MFAVICIIVALLQFSFGQNITEHDILEDVDKASVPSEQKEEDIQHIQPKVDDDDGDVTTADGIPVSDGNDEDEPSKSEGPVKTQAESVSESSGDVIAPENDLIADATVPNNIVTLSSPVMAGGKVTIIANFGCDGQKNIVTSHETDSKADADEVVPEGPTFGGPVHAQGKVSIGSHYGCGCPIGIPPILFPMPWFATQSPIYYPSVHFPGYLGSCVDQYLLPMAEQGMIPPLCQDPFNDPSSSGNSRENFPVASTLANSDASSEDQHHGLNFNGVVPASGSVSIAAKF